MKSAYELAMERLNKTAPSIKLNDAQKKQIAELEAKYKAKVAQREIALTDEIAAATSMGDFEKAEKLQQQLVQERKSIQAELEAKKAAVHDASARKS
jgi:hypothetical protein